MLSIIVLKQITLALSKGWTNEMKERIQLYRTLKVIAYLRARELDLRDLRNQVLLPFTTENAS